MISLLTYNKPILLVGNGVRQANAVEMMHEFVRKTNIPVLTTMNAVDLANDDLHIGFIGTHGNRCANLILQNCDLVISVGARLGIRQVGRNAINFAPKADLIRVDIDENELSRNIKDNEKNFHMDAKEFFRLFSEQSNSDYSIWKSKCLQVKKILEKYDIQEGNLVASKIGELLPKDAFVCVDVGMNQCWCAQSLILKGDYARMLISGGYGVMGCSLPYAIGASISLNRKKTFCLVGDGGIQMNIQELETVRRENLPIKIFVFNNKVLGKINETQHYNHNDRFAATAESGGYSVPEFEKIAIAYGIKAIKLSDYTKLDNCLEWINDDEPCLINIIMSKQSFLTPKIKFETGIMFPDIPKDIYKMIVELLNNN